MYTGDETYDADEAIAARRERDAIRRTADAAYEAALEEAHERPFTKYDTPVIVENARNVEFIVKGS